jgi:hypothetical protein
MKRIVETRFVWPLLTGHERWGKYALLGATAKIWSCESHIHIYLKFAIWQEDMSILDELREQLKRLPVEISFWTSSTAEKEVRISFAKQRKEDVCVTAHKTFLLILHYLNLQNTVLSYTPKIVQETLWRVSPKDMRGVWLSHGEYISRVMHP